MDRPKRTPWTLSRATHQVGPDVQLALSWKPHADGKRCSQVLKELKAMGVPEVQIHEPILTHTDAAQLKGDFETSFKAMADVELPLNLVCSLCCSRGHRC